MENHIHLDCVSSTSTYLKEIVGKCSPEKRRELFPSCFVVTASRQEQGKGRQQKTWESEPDKNLLFSVLLYPQIHPSQQFHVCRQVSVAVAEFVKETFSIENVYIKWPNDIYINDKKLAGILIEHFISGDTIHYSIVGIGININQVSFPAVLPNPISIYLETKEIHSLEFSLEKVMDKIKQVIERPVELLEKQYIDYLYKYNVFSNYILPKISQEPLLLKITGIDEMGLLRLEDAANQLYSCAFNEVIYCSEK
jgi:BirA family biotin operon repressor/biotin-[acetyl-CoA-carboxylase] ligase